MRSKSSGAADVIRSPLIRRPFTHGLRYTTRSKKNVEQIHERSASNVTYQSCAENIQNNRGMSTYTQLNMTSNSEENDKYTFCTFTATQILHYEGLASWSWENKDKILTKHVGFLSCRSKKQKTTTTNKYT